MFLDNIELYDTHMIKPSPRPDLRMDLELCLKERDFLEHRRKATKQGMCSLLGSHQGPSNEEEVRVMLIKVFLICFHRCLSLIIQGSQYLPDDIRRRIPSHDCLCRRLQSSLQNRDH